MLDTFSVLVYTIFNDRTCEASQEIISYERGILMHHIVRRAIALFASAAVMTVALAAEVSAAMDRSEFSAGYTYPTEMRGLSAFQIVSDMGAGWNLGNSLEAANTETSWGNPRTTKEMIDGIAEMGFTTIRVPVRWDDHYSDEDYTIDPQYMDRVETVVNYGLANGMYVIMNVHHNALQEWVPDTAAISEELTAIWTQVGKRFRDYGDKLIFEVNNEPRAKDDWNGNAEYYKCVNECNEAARAAIRATGGNNKERLVMLPTYAASADTSKAEAWKKATDDDMIAASVHAYLPFDFAFEGNGHSNWLETDLADLSTLFDRVYEHFISKGVPVVIGEFGAVNKNNTAEREKYVDAYAALARQFAEQDIPCVWWDNGAFGTGTENFGIYDRGGAYFKYESVAKALVDAYKGAPECEKSVTSRTEISGGGKCSGWGQAVNAAGTIVTSMNSGESIVAEYKSDKAPEMILQSFSVSSKAWVKVEPDSCKNGAAKWTYETLLKAFGGTFAGLDKVYIGDTGTNLEVSSVYINRGNAHTHDYSGKETITLEASATTHGRKAVYCSVSGCSAYKVVVTDYSSDNNTPDDKDDVKLGDADGNGSVNALDSAAILRYVVGAAALPNKAAADYDKNGLINALDAAAILKAIVTASV